MIRSELDVLLDKVQDQALRADLQSQIDRLKKRRSFGLVFEQHIPERVRLPQHPIRVGSQVVSRDHDDSPTFEVIEIEDRVAILVQVRDADGAYVQPSELGLGGQERAPLDSLVVISDFGEPVLPGFRHLGSIERGGDKPYHVLINGENHHVLEALRFTHAGKVDCIYIDPPYNSGARDWKYNNDYVDANDAYRHSKWLAFVERRLKLAKELLNPDDSVLIVMIDEREVHRLGLLLEQVFPAMTLQLVSIVNNPKGVTRATLSRVEEYALFGFVGSAKASSIGDDLLTPGADDAPSDPERHPRWKGLLRSGGNAKREQHPTFFYPVLANPETRRIVGAGASPPLGVNPELGERLDGNIAIWPVRRDGTWGRWMLKPETLVQWAQQGFVAVGDYDPKRQTWGVSYLTSEPQAQIAAGILEIRSIDSQTGVADVAYARDDAPSRRPKTVWHRTSHDAGVGGTAVLAALIPGRTFDYAKSLYAVRDSLDIVTHNKPEAVVLDFFAGSGTTAHAVMRLNHQDGGRRQSIVVTNNEVSAEEAKELRSRGLRPGDPDWESLGIFEHITRPRVRAAVTGLTPDGAPIAGEYKFTDEFPMADGFAENVAFLELRYLDPDDVDLGQAFDDLASLLWLRAGAQGPVARRADEAGNQRPFVWTERYGILFDTDRWRGFVSDRPDDATTAFIVTYSPTTFAGIAAELPTSMDTLRIPDTYLSMFLPERGRA